MISAFWILLFIILYIYIGYYFISLILSKIVELKVKQDEKFRPIITFVISAFNEEKVIKDKLNNTIKLDYPKDLINILVISDASDDRTDDIVESFDHRDVRLLRNTSRRGKTYGINEALKNVDSEIVVFSDANAIYKKNSLIELVKYFADPKVGYVVGNAQYYKNDQSDAGIQEDKYWSLEIKLKDYESKIGSVVGGDGAIYAIRRSLFLPLEEDDINDFVNPLHIILQGYRGIFNHKAICYEHTADTFEKEFSRKKRIVNRSWRGLMKNRSILNPFKTGIHAWQIFSHKFLRWLGGLFLLFFFVLNIILLNRGALYILILMVQVVFYLLGIIGYFSVKKNKKVPGFISVIYYFISVNIASLLGIIDNYFGKKYTTWQTVRDE